MHHHNVDQATTESVFLLHSTSVKSFEFTFEKLVVNCILTVNSDKVITVSTEKLIYNNMAALPVIFAEGHPQQNIN